MASSEPVRLQPTAAQRLRARLDLRARSGDWVFFGLILPAAGFLAIFFVIPVLDILWRSVDSSSGLTLEHYARFFSRPVYLRVLLLTIKTTLTVTAITLIVAYPLAFVITTARPAASRIMITLVLLPFFTSLLVRTYAWMAILGQEGIVNRALGIFGLGPVTLIYNWTGVLIGLVYTMLPYMVMTLYSVMKGIEPQFMRVAYSLGASELKAFRRVYWPLTLPGVMGGCLLVAIMTMGYFITPRLMGGPGDQMLASIVDNQIEAGLNFNFAAAISVVLLAITLAGFALYARLVGLRRLLESKV